MAFDEKLRAYLEGVERGEPEPPHTRHRQVDVEALRQAFLRGLQTRADEEVFVRHAYELWTPLLASFARHVEHLPPHLGASSPDEAVELAAAMIGVALDLDPGLPLLRRLELERLATEFDTFAAIGERYTRETRLVRRGPSSGAQVLTALARTFVRLPGKDGVRWLLTIETSLSRGSQDDLLVPRELLAEAMSAGGLRVTDGITKTHYHTGAMTHAEDLGAVEWLDADATSPLPRYVVPAGMRDVVQSVLDRGPWHAAIAGMLEDERTAVVGAPSSTASDAVLEQSRMITHEVRNALMPVRHHIDWIAPHLDDAELRERLGRVRRGVVRMLDFAENMVQLSEAAQEPVTVTGFDELAREAAALVDDGVVVIEAPDIPLPIRARRSRIVLALVNLLRNSLQAARSPAAVTLGARVEGATARIDVDDNGRGVPETDRSIIFTDGYTTRPGGSGFGLAYVKRVVETELRGKVWCEDSHLGGARFSIEFPLTDRAT